MADSISLVNLIPDLLNRNTVGDANQPGQGCM